MHNLLGGIEFIMRGGFMMYPLLISGLIALTAIVERLYSFFRRFYRTRENFTQTLFWNIVHANQLSQASDKRCKEPKIP